MYAFQPQRPPRSIVMRQGSNTSIKFYQNSPMHKLTQCEYSDTRYVDAHLHGVTSNTQGEDSIPTPELLIFSGLILFLFRLTDYII
ncbi:predicted protein [Botrytis cinerea T4]|uniref:Uncharacterized protein n=1 Tax=Botryotinia fuckeliana (strain T4) TaxID=999810 RepID=G2XPD7_BOTF4|nr:predicted protein [Botrytis cinerea T4]